MTHEEILLKRVRLELAAIREALTRPGATTPFECGRKLESAIAAMGSLEECLRTSPPCREVAESLRREIHWLQTDLHPIGLLIEQAFRLAGGQAGYNPQGQAPAHDEARQAVYG